MKDSDHGTFGLLYSVYGCEVHVDASDCHVESEYKSIHCLFKDLCINELCHNMLHAEGCIGSLTIEFDRHIPVHQTQQCCVSFIPKHQHVPRCKHGVYILPVELMRTTAALVLHHPEYSA